MMMTHAFADVVAWLHFYDLDSLLLTDARCSDLAHSAASKIRVFDFSGFEFAAYDDIIFINRLVDVRVPSTYVTELNFLDEGDLVGFIPAALQNCVLGNLELLNRASIEALRDVARTIVVKGTLHLYPISFANAHALLEFAVSFRSVQRVRVCCDGPQVEELSALFDRHGFGIQPDTNQAWVSFVTYSA